MSRHLRNEERSRGRDQAVWALRDHGDGAEAFIAAKLARPMVSASDRRRYRHSLRHLRILRAEQRDEIREAARHDRPSLPRRLVAWLFGWSRERRMQR